MSSLEGNNCLMNAMIHDDRAVLDAVEMLGSCSICYCGVLAESKPVLRQTGTCTEGLSAAMYAPEVDKNAWRSRQQKLHR